MDWENKHWGENLHGRNFHSKTASEQKYKETKVTNWIKHKSSSRKTKTILYLQILTKKKLIWQIQETETIKTIKC